MGITPFAEHTDKDRNCDENACDKRGGIGDYGVIDRPKRLRDQAKYSHILGLDAIEADHSEYTSHSGEKRNKGKVPKLDKFKYRRKRGKRDKHVEPEAVACPPFAPPVVKYGLARHSYRIEQSARVCSGKQVIQRPYQVRRELKNNYLGATLGGVYKYAECYSYNPEGLRYCLRRELFKNVHFYAFQTLTSMILNH